MSGDWRCVSFAQLPVWAQSNKSNERADGQSKAAQWLICCPPQKCAGMCSICVLIGDRGYNSIVWRNVQGQKGKKKNFQ